MAGRESAGVWREQVCAERRREMPGCRGCRAASRLCSNWLALARTGSNWLELARSGSGAVRAWSLDEPRQPGGPRLHVASRAVSGAGAPGVALWREAQDWRQQGRRDVQAQVSVTRCSHWAQALADASRRAVRVDSDSCRGARPDSPQAGRGGAQQGAGRSAGQTGGCAGRGRSGWLCVARCTSSGVVWRSSATTSGSPGGTVARMVRRSPSIQTSRQPKIFLCMT